MTRLRYPKRQSDRKPNEDQIVGWLLLPTDQMILGEPVRWSGREEPSGVGVPVTKGASGRQEKRSAKVNSEKRTGRKQDFSVKRPSRAGPKRYPDSLLEYAHVCNSKLFCDNRCLYLFKSLCIIATMDAQPSKLLDYFSGEKQNLVPLFQRAYTWSRGDWACFWEDLVDACGFETADQRHFLGAVVTSPVASVPVGVAKHLLIDGQQRLTTAALLLAAIRDEAAGAGAAKLADQINDDVVNRYQEGADRWKVLPTVADRLAFVAVMSQPKEIATIDLDQDAPVTKAYQYFRQRIEQFVDQDEFGSDPEAKLKHLFLTARTRLYVVAISLSTSDDPYVIFESLNHKGQPLSQADLVRNNVLMRFPHTVETGGTQQKVYDQFWRPIEKAIDAAIPDATATRRATVFSEFFRHYVMVDGVDVRKANTYAEVKKKLDGLASDDTAPLIEELARLGRLANDYRAMLCPADETDPVLRRAFEVFDRLDTTLPFPFVLQIREARRAGTIDEKQLRHLVSCIESFLIRRTSCNVPTNMVRRLILTWIRALDPTDAETFQRLPQLMAAGQRTSRWPDDDEFTKALVRQPQYGIRSTRAILERLEIHYDHKEPAALTNATIEHVMPQKLTEIWRECLPEPAESSHQTRLHTLGNLTFSASEYNSSMGTLPFSAGSDEDRPEALNEQSSPDGQPAVPKDKRSWLGRSHYELNRSIASQRSWGPGRLRHTGEDGMVVPDAPSDESFSSFGSG